MNKIIHFFQQPCKGRLNRTQFFIGFLVGMVGILLGIIFSKMFLEMFLGTKEFWYGFILFSLALIIAIFFLFVSVYVTWSLYIRRLYDVGVSGWCFIIIMILSAANMILGTLFILSLFFIPGEKGANSYGEQTQSFNVKQILFNKKHSSQDTADKYIDIFLFSAVLISVVLLVLNNFST